MTFNFGSLSPDNVPDFLDCEGHCVSRRIHEILDLNVRKISHDVPGEDPDVYVNIDDLGAIFYGLIALQITAVEHTPGATQEAAKPVILGMLGLAENVRMFLYESGLLVESSVPETIPEGWTAS